MNNETQMETNGSKSKGQSNLEFHKSFHFVVYEPELEPKWFSGVDTDNSE